MHVCRCVCINVRIHVCLHAFKKCWYISINVYCAYEYMGTCLQMVHLRDVRMRVHAYM